MGPSQSHNLICFLGGLNPSWCLTNFPTGNLNQISIKIHISSYFWGYLIPLGPNWRLSLILFLSVPRGRWYLLHWDWSELRRTLSGVLNGYERGDWLDSLTFGCSSWTFSDAECQLHKELVVDEAESLLSCCKSKIFLCSNPVELHGKGNLSKTWSENQHKEILHYHWPGIWMSIFWLNRRGHA